MAQTASQIRALVKRLHDEGKKRGLDKGQLNQDFWMVHPRTGDQYKLSYVPDADRYDLLVVPNDGQNRRTDRSWSVWSNYTSYWLRGQKVAANWPDTLARQLGSLDYLPNPFKVYGMRRSGRLVVLFTPWQYDDGQCHGMSLPSYMLQGEPRPDLFKSSGKTEFVDTKAWWRGVNSGQISEIPPSSIRSCTSPVLARRGRDRKILYYLFRGPEALTGLSGPGLYVWAGSREQITLENALDARGGYDIRRNFKTS